MRVHMLPYRISRQKQPPIRHFKDPLDKTFSEMLWSDPRPEKGVTPSRRGAGIYWGPDVTERFLVVRVVTKFHSEFF